MSAVPTDCRVPDPTDAKADGAFGGSHRAGYGSDRLQRAEAWARKGYTLAAGEGLVLVQELDRLRALVQDLWQQRFTEAATGVISDNAGEPEVEALREVLRREPRDA